MSSSKKKRRGKTEAVAKNSGTRRTGPPGRRERRLNGVARRGTPWDWGTRGGGRGNRGEKTMQRSSRTTCSTGGISALKWYILPSKAKKHRRVEGPGGTTELWTSTARVDMKTGDEPGGVA